MTAAADRTGPRIACVDVPALPLQLLLARRPAWRPRPVAVVEKDAPQGLVLFVNAAAFRAGVRTGMRHGAALALAPALRADVVPGEEVAAGVAALTARLLTFTPGVEPGAGTPGVFHLDASGLSRLHGSVAAWAAAVLRGLADAGFVARIAAGFTRFGVYAAARTGRGAVVFATQEDEARAARGVALGRLGAGPALVATLTKLGVVTVGDFLALPEEGLARRFGDEALHLHRFAAGGPGTPLHRAVPEEPLEEGAALEHPETDAARLVFLAKRLADRLLAKAAARRLAVAGIALRLVLERHPSAEEDLRVAAPTLDAAQILDLVQLRLAALRLPSGVVRMTVAAAAVPATEEQLQLFAERPRRDPAAAERAFARIAAEFGADAVVVARLAEGHLPETQFAWETFSRAVSPRPSPPDDPPLVRRILAEPLALPHPPVTLPGGWLVSTRWWTEAPVRREYRVAARSGCLLSLAFHDFSSGVWFFQGEPR
jgi:protein ImuB